MDWKLLTGRTFAGQPIPDAWECGGGYSVRIRTDSSCTLAVVEFRGERVKEISDKDPDRARDRAFDWCRQDAERKYDDIRGVLGLPALAGEDERRLGDLLLKLYDAANDLTIAKGEGPLDFETFRAAVLASFSLAGAPGKAATPGDHS